MISKEKGNIGEAVILAEFIKRGIQVSIPFGDSARYDLIAEFNGKLNKIQIKYCDYLSENDSMICPCRSSTNHTTNKHYTTYENDVDYICFYIPRWNKTMIIPIEIIGNRKEICVRLTYPKNGQRTKITLVDDYSFDKILCVETLHDEPTSN